MHDRLFAEQDRLGLDDLVGHAQALGIDAERFLESLRDGVHEAAIEADVDTAERSGVTGTPTFFVNGERVRGPHDGQALQQALDSVAV
jgi:predicted DsbA family dithiol-disulfide isomerase